MVSMRPASLDLRLLHETLPLAARGGRRVHPDPYVGAVLARPGSESIVGRGYHGRNGATHAEPVAIADAGDRAAGATLYCNLEPCGYEAPEKRQPPCVRAIIEAGVARVVVGQVDPHPRVRGNGLRKLADAGIEVVLAPDPLPFWLANPVFTTAMTLDRPFVHVTTAASPPVVEGLVYDHVAVDGSVGDLGADVHSVLVHAAEPGALTLPDGWEVDFFDGRPSSTWERNLRAALSSWLEPAAASGLVATSGVVR